MNKVTEAIKKFQLNWSCVSVQVAEMMVFLCSDAASQITGSNIIMDGGWCAK